VVIDAWTAEAIHGVHFAPWYPAPMRTGALLLLLAGCSDLPDLYDDDVDRVVFEVDYMPGAEPEVGAHAGIDDVWRIAVDNTRAVLGDDKDYVFPHRLEDMSMIEAVVPSELTKQDILDIARLHRDERDSETTRTMYLVWIDGVLVRDGEPRHNVGAVSIDDSRVIAVFKPAIVREAAAVREDHRALVEQIVLVHELGHAYGLVDRGIPREEEQEPEQEPWPTLSPEPKVTDRHHCHVESCVMNAGAGASHVGLVQEDDLVIFGETCLEDVRRARD
jgi:hypothetical protein